MKLAMVRLPDREFPAISDGDGWIALDEAIDRHAVLTGGTGVRIRDTNEALAQGWFDPSRLKSLVDTLRQHGQLDALRIPAPVRFGLPIRPGKIVAVGRNYAAHVRELGNEIPEEPIIFSKSPTACIADGEAIVVCDRYGRVDYEGELALVIGRRLKNAGTGDAASAVAGYTLLNDVTARDMQTAYKAKGKPWFLPKNLDTFCPIGPVIALPDVMPSPLHVDITLTVNGELRQQGNTGQFLFRVPELLAYITSFMTLEPGDLIATGTPEGVGPIRPGDLIEITAPQIGTLRNPVVRGG